MIKLIASDIDGTLVADGENHINPEYFDVILKLREKGIQFAAATGRQWASIEQLFEPIKEKIFYLSDNGSYVGCHGRNLFLYPIERGLANELILDIRNTEGLDAVVSGPDTSYVETKNEELIHWLIEGYKFKVKQVEDLTKVEDQFIKVSAYKASGVQKTAAPLKAKYESRLKIALAGDMWMDSVALGVNKGEAIKTLQENLNILPEETMAFGDQHNDIEMLNQAYYSFAIGNAKDEVKKAARFQADTNLNDGVLKVLKALL